MIEIGASISDICQGGRGQTLVSWYIRGNTEEMLWRSGDMLRSIKAAKR